MRVCGETCPVVCEKQAMLEMNRATLAGPNVLVKPFAVAAVERTEGFLGYLAMSCEEGPLTTRVARGGVRYTVTTCTSTYEGLQVQVTQPAFVRREQVPSSEQ